MAITSKSKSIPDHEVAKTVKVRCAAIALMISVLDAGTCSVVHNQLCAALRGVREAAGRSIQTGVVCHPWDLRLHAQMQVILGALFELHKRMQALCEMDLPVDLDTVTPDEQAFSNAASAEINAEVSAICGQESRETTERRHELRFNRKARSDGSEVRA